MNIASLLPELNPILGEFLASLPTGKLLLVEEYSPLDGSFIFYYYASLFLKSKDNTKIIFVCANETVNHYNVVSAKLGLMFARHSDQDRIHFLPLSNLLRNSMEQHSNVLELLVHQLQIMLNSCTEKDCAFLLVIDSASILLDLCGDMSQVESLISSLSSFVSLHNGTLCTLVNRGMPGHETVPSDMSSCLADSLAHLANTRFILTPIGAGFSKDVTGQMCIEQVADTCLMPRKHTLHYRLGDRSIQLIAPGLSQPALVE